MSQKEQKCAYCHAILFEDDDIVYCHLCGAPHHRDCYTALGRCAREDAHGQEPEPELEQSEPVQEESRPEGIPFDRDGHVCTRCGKRSTSDTLFCPYCANPFVEAGAPKPNYSAYSTTFAGVDPYGGVNPNESLDGHAASEVASYVRVNTQRYLPIFKRSADTNKKVGWNWASFFFTYVWLFFRKCYREGLVAILFTLLATVMQTPWLASFYAYMQANGLTVEALMAQTAEATQHATALLTSIPPFAWLMYLLGSLVILLVSVIFGLYGDYFYRKRVSTRLTQIKEDERFADKASAIAAAGGCNVFSAVAIMYGMNLASNIILTFFLG